ncbi:hypothetical protein CATMIT_01912, partial [Catenibacterium mitsuokai DSM 15897]
GRHVQGRGAGLAADLLVQRAEPDQIRMGAQVAGHDPALRGGRQVQIGIGIDQAALDERARRVRAHRRARLEPVVGDGVGRTVVGAIQLERHASSCREARSRRRG